MSELEFIASFLAEISPFVDRRYADKGSLGITTKQSPSDLLTEVDLAVQKMAVERIAAAFPDDIVIAEEGDHAQWSTHAPERSWIMDPIDGTQNFVRGIFPAYGVSLAFARGKQVVAAGVSMATAKRTYLAERGAGATCNGVRVRVSEVADLPSARLEVDFAYPGKRAATLRTADRLMREVGQIRCHGAAVVGICAVATGDAEAYLHVCLNPWDYAAAQLVCEEAGGKVTRLDGAPAFPFDADQSFLATNGLLHQALLERLPAR